MKNKKNEKKSVNSILYVGCISVGILILFLGAAYLVAGSILESNAAKDEAGLGSRPVFMSDAGKSSTLSLGTVTKQDVKMSLQNNINTTTICHYNIYWEWDETAQGYYASVKDANELTITGTVGNTEIFSDIAINDFHLAEPKTLVYSGYIVNHSASLTSKTWHFDIDFTYLDGVDQSKHYGKNYTGKLLVEDVMCKETKYLKDKILADPQIKEENGYRYVDEQVNNYVCFGTPDAACPETSLFRVLAYEDDAIKLVSAITYGAGKWHDEYVAGLQHSYIYYHFEKDKEIILEKDYPLVDITDESLSASEVYKLEKNSEKKIRTKVALLSYSDVKYAKWLESYTMPYLILSETGSGISTYGHSSNIANGVSYIYPVIYIPDDVTTSSGNGTEANPYFIN